MANPNRDKVTGLWVREWVNPQGETVRYMTGKSDGMSYSIWPNGFKEKETDPTHVLFKEPAESLKPAPKKEDLPF